MSRPGYDMEIEHPQGIQMSHVFLIVLALHVLVIGGALGYHWMRGRLGDDKAAVAKQEKPIAPEGAGPKVAFRTGGFEPVSEKPLPLEERRVRPVDRESTGLDAIRLAQGKPAAPPPSAAPGAAPPPAPLSVVTAVAAVPATPTPPKTVAQQPAQQPVQQLVEHTVGKGEVLGKIAKKHGVSVAALREANGLHNDLIRVGQKLKVPAREAAAPAQVAAAMPATTKPAPPIQVAAAAPAPTPAKPAAAKTQTAQTGESERVYVVSKGDTLWGISKRFKTAPERIARANRLSDPGRLKIGMKLVIPLDMSGAAGEPTKTPASQASAVAMSGV